MNTADIELLRSLGDPLDKLFRDMVQQLGDRIGYGNLMSTASIVWGEKHPGTNFAVGPCTLGTVTCDHGGGLAKDCDWCCGCGWLTKHVSEVKEKLEGEG